MHWYINNTQTQNSCGHHPTKDGRRNWSYEASVQPAVKIIYSLLLVLLLLLIISREYKNTYVHYHYYKVMHKYG